MYFIRYTSEVPVQERRHEQTLGRFDTWDEAEQERQTREDAGRLETVGPR